MKNTRRFTGCFAFVGILILILDGKTALYGAQTGIDLCIRTVIPSLFPFFLLSVLLNSALSGTSAPMLRPVLRLFSMGRGTEAIWISGFLGGYPSGAQAVASAYHAERLRLEEANRLLSFCSNAGPAFLFGMVSPLFSKPGTSFALWTIHIAGAFFVSVLLPPVQREAAPAPRASGPSFSDAMHTSIRVMASVCGWIVVFRVLLAFLDRWVLWLLPTAIRCAVCGVLELSNGCCALPEVANEALRFVLCSGMLGWGGICVALQTASVTEGLSMGSYLKGKLLQTIFSLLLSASIVLKIWLPVTALLLILICLLQKMQNRGSNPGMIGV